MDKVVLTPEIVRKLCRQIGGSTNSRASDVEYACGRIIDGEDVDKVISDIRIQNGGGSNEDRGGLG